jgi:hypothetical protein
LNEIYCVFSLKTNIKRGVLRRGTAIAWPNGIVPYQFLPGYGMDIFIQKVFVIFEKNTY